MARQRGRRSKKSLDVLLSEIEADSIEGSGLGSWVNGILDIWGDRLTLTDNSHVPKELRDVAAKEGGRFAATIVQLTRGTPKGEFLVAHSGAEHRLASLDWNAAAARRALALLQAIGRLEGQAAEYFARWLAITEARSAQDINVTPWNILELCSKAQTLAKLEIQRHQTTSSMLAKERARLRKEAGRDNPTGRRGQDIESVALYLWMVLRVRHGWTEDKASKILYEFMMKGRNGLTGNGNGKTVRCVIWPTVASGRTAGDRTIPPWHTALSPRMRRAVRQLAAFPRKPGPYEGAERALAAGLKIAAK